MIKIIKDSQLINQTAEVSLSVASPAKDGDDSLSDKPPSEENQGGAALGDSESVTDAGKAGASPAALMLLSDSTKFHDKELQAIVTKLFKALYVMSLPPLFMRVYPRLTQISEAGEVKMTIDLWALRQLAHLCLELPIPESTQLVRYQHISGVEHLNLFFAASPLHPEMFHAETSPPRYEPMALSYASLRYLLDRFSEIISQDDFLQTEIANAPLPPRPPAISPSVQNSVPPSDPAALPEKLLAAPQPQEQQQPQEPQQPQQPVSNGPSGAVAASLTVDSAVMSNGAVLPNGAPIAQTANYQGMGSLGYQGAPAIPLVSPMMPPSPNPFTVAQQNIAAIMMGDAMATGAYGPQEIAAAIEVVDPITGIVTMVPVSNYEQMMWPLQGMDGGMGPAFNYYGQGQTRQPYNNRGHRKGSRGTNGGMSGAGHQGRGKGAGGDSGTGARKGPGSRVRGAKIAGADATTSGGKHDGAGVESQGPRPRNTRSKKVDDGAGNKTDVSRGGGNAGVHEGNAYGNAQAVEAA